MIISLGKVLPDTFGQRLYVLGSHFFSRCANEQGGGVNEALSRGSQGRAEIAQFVVDLLRFTYGLGDFVAEQTAITVTQPVYEIFHCRFLNAECPGKCRVRYIFPLRSETTTQDIKDAPS